MGSEEVEPVIGEVRAGREEMDPVMGVRGGREEVDTVIL